MRTIIIISIFFLPILGVAQQRTGIDQWIKKNTITSEFDNILDTKPFEVFGSYIHDKRIIALGEPTHGSKEAQLLRLKLFKYLVQHNGFTTIALEAFDNSGAVNDYLLYGKGTSSEAVKAMGMWMYGTEETKELVSWMRQYNSSHIEKIRFYGADVIYKFDFKHLKDSISHFPEINIKLIDSIAEINERYLGKKDRAPLEILQHLKIKVNKFDKNIKEAKIEIESKVSKNYYSFLVYSINSYKQAIDGQIKGKKVPSYYRDSCMAANVDFISKSLSSNEKVLYGAHNAHTQYGKYRQTKTAGSFIKELHKDRFYNIGVEFGEYTFRSLIWSSRDKKYIQNINSIASPKKNSLGEALSEINDESFYVDFKNSIKDKTYELLFEQRRPILYVGWLFSPGYDNDFYQKKSLSSLYDGLFYVKKSSETTFTQK